jgi:hypothetical protein
MREIRLDEEHLLSMTPKEMITNALDWYEEA